MLQLVAEVRGEPDDATRWTTLGMAYEANRLLDPARQSYEQAVELDSAGPRSWYRLAMARAALGDVDGAITAVRRTTAVGMADRQLAMGQAATASGTGCSALWAS